MADWKEWRMERWWGWLGGRKERGSEDDWEEGGSEDDWEEVGRGSEEDG